MGINENTELMSYLGELVRAQLDNRVPKTIPEGITLNQLMDIARKGQIVYLIHGALLKLSLKEEEYNLIRPGVVNSTIKTLRQVCLINELSAELEKAGIRNQFLKGSVMKFVYPNPEMREMSDVDIMIYESSLDKTDSILCKMGFTKKTDIKHHSIYANKAGIIVEAHWDLYDCNVDKEQFVYYKDNFRAVLSEGKKYSFEFTKEDFYVYMISHMAKHFYETGCGVRNLVDIYVYNNAYDGVIERSTVDREFKRLGLDEFEKHMKNLAYIWLDNCPASQFYIDLFEYMLDCGIYGKGENGVWGQLIKGNADLDRKRSRLKKWYYFPPKSYMTEYYPWLRNRTWLLPVAWIIRAFHGITNRDSIERKNLISNADRDTIMRVGNIYKTLNLDFKK